MFRKLPIFIVAFFLCFFAFEVGAQTATDSSGGSTVSSSSDASGGSTSGIAPSQGSSLGSAPTATRTGAVAIPPRGVPAPTRASTVGRPPPVAPVLTPESIATEGTVSPAAEIPVPTTPTEKQNTLPLIFSAGALVLLIGGVVSFFRKKGQGENNKKEESPCDGLKKDYEIKKAEYEQAIKNVSFQEIVVEGLERKIEAMKGKVEDEVKGEIKKTARKIKDEIVSKEKTGTLKEAVAVLEETKETYDDLQEKYEQAKKWLQALKNLKSSLAKELNEKESAYNACVQGNFVASVVENGGLEVDLPEGRAEEKVIFVDAPTYMAAYKVLERYPNKKFILTRTRIKDDKNFSRKKKVPYEVFVLDHNPKKPNHERYEDVFKYFGFAKEEEQKNSKDIGFKTLKELKKFLDESL